MPFSLCRSDLSGLRVTQGHQKWLGLIENMRLPINLTTALPFPGHSEILADSCEYI